MRIGRPVLGVEPEFRKLELLLSSKVSVFGLKRDWKLDAVLVAAADNGNSDVQIQTREVIRVLVRSDRVPSGEVLGGKLLCGTTV